MTDQCKIVPIRSRKPLIDTSSSEATGNSHAADFFGALRDGIPLHVAITDAADALAHDIAEEDMDARTHGCAEISAFIDTLLEAVGFEGTFPERAA